MSFVDPLGIRLLERKKPTSVDLYIYYFHFVSRCTGCTEDDPRLCGLQESCQSTESVHKME